MANAFVYILFIVAVFFRVLILWWGALRLQPQHEQTWAVREPRLRHFHRRRVNAYLAVLAMALLGFVLLMTQSTQAQLQARQRQGSGPAGIPYRYVRSGTGIWPVLAGKYLYRRPVLLHH